MARVAKALLGVPNQSLSKQGKEWRYGTHGSLAIDLHKGTYFDFETDEGGGVLDLIKREKGLTGGAAIDFMRQIGCDLPPLGPEGDTYQMPANWTPLGKLPTGDTSVVKLQPQATP